MHAVTSTGGLTVPLQVNPASHMNNGYQYICMFVILLRNIASESHNTRGLWNMLLRLAVGIQLLIVKLCK